jgi:hypothetical protein
MEDYMAQHKRKWLVIAALIATFFIVGITGNLFIMSQLTQGTIELPAELPSPEMMAHIAANLDQLIEPNGPFTRSEGFGIVTALDYANDSGLTIMITLESGASPEEFLAAEPKWQGQYLGFSDLLAALSGAGKYTLMFSCSQGPFVLFITQEDAAAISTIPLTEALSIIQSIIGTP